MAIEETGEALVVAAPLAEHSADRWRDWIAIAVMLSSAPCLALMFTATSPVLPVIAAHFAPPGHPAFTIPWIDLGVDGTFYSQLMQNVPSAALFLGGGSTGWAIDRYGVRRVLLWALAAFILLGSAGLYIDNAVWLLVSRFGLGFAAVAFGSATIWLIGGRFDDAGRARILSYRNIAGSIAGIVWLLVAGQAAEVAGWNAEFALFLLPLVLIPAAIFAIHQPESALQSSAAAGERASLRFLWPFLVMGVLLAVAMMMTSTQLSFLLVENGVTGSKRISHIMVAGSAANMVGSVLYSILGPRLSARTNYTAFALLLGMGGVTLGLSHDAVTAMMGGVLTGSGAGWLIPHFSRMILGRAPASARGRAVGLFFSAIYLGDLLNPFVIRPIVMSIGIHGAFLLVGSFVALSALQIVIPEGVFRKVALAGSARE